MAIRPRVRSRPLPPLEARANELLGLALGRWHAAAKADGAAFTRGYTMAIREHVAGRAHTTVDAAEALDEAVRLFRQMQPRKRARSNRRR